MNTPPVSFGAMGHIHIESGEAFETLKLAANESIAWSAKPWPTQEINMAPASLNFSAWAENFRPAEAEYVQQHTAAFSVHLLPTMKLSEGETIALTTGPLETAKELRFRLSSPSFAITASERQGSWQWIIQPSAAGAFKLLLEPVSKSKAKPAKIDWIIPAELGKAITVEGNGTLILSVQVLTSLGLTATQDAWLKALGALLGVLGTVFGYPFWKKYLEGSSSQTAAAGAGAASGTPGSTASTATKKMVPDQRRDGDQKTNL